jgi:predicted XRE-type DNA-binding protein
MTKKTPIRKWLEGEGNTQTKLAELVGVTQGAIWQMVNGTRDIFVVETGERTYLEEIRKIGSAA